MNKVVYNDTYGGFCLSVEAVKWLAENGHGDIKSIAEEEIKKSPAKYPGGVYGYHLSIKRHDKDLVRCVETLGRAANGGFAKLAIHEIKGRLYRIENYDGWEDVYEPEDETYEYIGDNE